MNRTNHFLSTSRTALILLLATLLTATAAQTAWADDYGQRHMRITRNWVICMSCSPMCLLWH